jgi:chromate reductase
MISLQPEIVEIGQLPLYNQDLDDSGNPPAAWTAFRQQVKPRRCAVRDA